ncbi:MAG TPA: PAS domain S-box protein [Verrucomicrobiae bacterium]
MQSKSTQQAFRAALFYVLAAASWILFSDNLVPQLFRQDDERTTVEIIKGWLFVLFTGFLLFLMVRRLLRRWEREAQHRVEAEINRQAIVDQLHRREEQLRLVFEASADGLWDWDIKADIVYLSPRYWEIAGYATTELIPNFEFFKRLIHPDDWERCHATIREHFDGKTSQSVFEFRMVTKSGAEKWVWGRGKVVSRAADGSPLRMVGTISDITERKEAETALRQSEARYRQVFELVSDAFVVGDRETHQILDVNQAAQQLYHYRRDEFLHLRLEDVSDEPEASAASINRGDSRVPLRWHRKKNGERFAVEISSSRLEYGGRQVVLSIVRDITSRQKVLDELRETTRQLIEAQKLARLGSYSLTVASGTWTGSVVLDEVFGIEDPHFTRDVAGWLSIVHPDDRASMERYFRDQVLANKMPFDRTYRIVRINDQRERWVHGLGKLILNEAGEIERMVGVIQDVTERKKAEEQMELQSSALTAVDNAIVITNHRGDIEWINPAFTKLTGYDAAEAIGSNMRLLNSGEHPPRFYANLWATILTGNVWRGEIINRRKDGQCYTEEMTITPARDTNGQIAHFVAIKQDVTERHLLEKRMQQAQKMEAIGTLAGGIAHDFNNILAAMFGYAYLLQQDFEGNAAATENIGEILKAAGRAKDLVQQILTFSRQREHKQQVIPLDIVVKEAIKFLRASLPALIKIDLKLAEDAPSVLADPTQIYQVVINLATNALHAMEGKSGILTVTLEPFEPDAAFIRLHPELRRQAYARLTVADTGEGIEAKNLERIFEPFFTTKPVGKGTGLGLSVVHGIVQGHGGLITVESEVGRGATFRIYFPGQLSAAAAAVTPQQQMPQGWGQRILVVDDESALTEMLRRLLTRMNYCVTISNNPHEAIQWCRENVRQFDLVITDLTMPDLNGLEVARQIHTLRPDLPVVLASGFIAELNPESLRAAGICASIEKPIAMATLAHTLARVFAGEESYLA